MKFNFDTDDERERMAARLGLPPDAPAAELQAGLARLLTAPVQATAGTAGTIRGAATVEDVRREFYNSVPDLDLPDWSWIRSMNLEPDELIVDDDDGALWRVPFAIDKDDNVSFSEPTKIKIEYITAANGTVGMRLKAEAPKTVLVTFDTKEASAKPVDTTARRSAAGSEPVGPYLNECEAAIAAAIKADKIPPSRADRYRRLWEHDPQDTKKKLAQLASVPGLNSGAYAENGDDSYPSDWFTAGAPQATTTRPTGHPRRRTQGGD